MANTYTLIASNTLGSSAASVTFSSIPGTYTDLVLRGSIRFDIAQDEETVFLEFNASSTANYSTTILRSNGSSADSANFSNQSYLNLQRFGVGTTATSNTFSNFEIYIPSYTASQNKPSSGFGVAENNSSTAYMAATAGLWRNTSAITSIKLSQPGVNLLTGSSFFLYGVKNT